MHLRHKFCLPLAAFAAALALGAAAPAATPDPPEWSQPQAPFRTVGGIYYVGSRGLASYLIVSPAGDILIDGTVPENAPMIERNIRALGFHLHDVKILLNTHAHFDHAGGLARLKKDTGAVFMASPADRWALEHGKSRGDNTANIKDFPPVKVDRLLADGQVLRLGGIRLTTIMTPGHTPGCTTWTMPVVERGRSLTVAFAGCFSVAANVLVGNRTYPGIAADYRKSFARLKALKIDVLLPTHPEFTDLMARRQRAAAGDANAFIDPGQLGRILAWAEPDFDKELAAEEAKAKTPKR
jgi:metallo-beta-lactamase class B